MPRPIALFIDGTWNHADAETPTNVWRLYGRLQTRMSFTECPHWYLDGVGTERHAAQTAPRWAQEAALCKPRVPGRTMRRLLGGAAGYGVGRLIKEGYAFLSEHYEPGDAVFLFGFSRGAFIARSLAGFMAEVGLLLKGHLADVEKAYALYVSKDSRQRYRLRRHLRRVTGKGRPSEDERLPVHLLGLWDTVEAYGLPRALQVLRPLRTDHHRIGIPAFVTHVRHALALHECRASFEPTLFEEALQPHQSLVQRWFAGAHADVGGGYADRQALPAVALDWMAREAHRLGLPVWEDPHQGSAEDLVQVHHEVRGFVFGSRLARVRRALRKVVEANPCQVGSHQLDTQAAARLLALGSDPYLFARLDVCYACRSVDVLSAALALRRAQAIGQAPVADWCGMRISELSGAADQVVAVFSDPVKTLMAEIWDAPAGRTFPNERIAWTTDREKLQRDMLLITVLGDVQVFERLRKVMLEFEKRAQRLTEPEMLSRAVVHFDSVIRLIQVPAWAAAASVNGQFESLMLQLEVQRTTLVTSHAKQAQLIRADDLSLPP